MSNQFIPPVIPLVDADETDSSEAVVTREVDGEEVLDPDTEGDSVEADRIASGADDHD